MTHIYFLINKDSIVYIGRTTKLFARIRVHCWERNSCQYKGKRFDRYESIEIQDDTAIQAKAMEAFLIHIIKPYYNGLIRGGRYDGQYVKSRGALSWDNTIDLFGLRHI